MKIANDDQWNVLSDNEKLDTLRDEARHQRVINREARKRTFFYSAIVAGLVALFIGRAIEISSLNQQQERSRTNCTLAQRGLKLTIDTYDDQADGILGDNSKHDGDRNEKIQPFQLKHTPFAKFEPLLIAQAKANRDRANQYRGLIVNCGKVFPTVHFVFDI